ncbi:MAG: hypothetical protein ACOYB3_01180 [Azonexus sp.]
MTKAERQLIALEKGFRNCRKILTTMIREISPKSRHAVKDIKLANPTSRRIVEPVTDDALIGALGTFSIQRGDSGWHVYPPERAIDTGVWNRIRVFMRNNGGTWMSQRQAFVFEEDPTTIFKALYPGKIVNDKKERQAFYTPDAIANKVAELADVSDRMVLEPSAGDGALADALNGAGADEVVCFEIDKACCTRLRAKGYEVRRGDFLAMSPADMDYERIVMNPPFAKDAYVAHIDHAMKFLAPGGRLVAIIPGDRVSSKLSDVLPPNATWTCYPLPKSAFKESGTNIQTSILVINLNQNK